MTASPLIKCFFAICAGLMVAGCAAPAAPARGHLGFTDERRLVVVGENVKPEIAAYYQKRYDALVWFTVYQGKVGNAANNLMESGLGPSRPMRALIKELQSINYTIGRWEIIVPGIAERYFLKTLKNMPTRSLAKARGMVVLVGTTKNEDMEREVARVSDNNFFVNYAPQDDIK